MNIFVTPKEKQEFRQYPKPRFKPVYYEDKYPVYRCVSCSEKLTLIDMEDGDDGMCLICNP